MRRGIIKEFSGRSRWAWKPDAIKSRREYQSARYETDTDIDVNYSGENYHVRYMSNYSGGETPAQVEGDFFEMFHLVDICGNIFQIDIDFRWLSNRYLDGKNVRSIFKAYNLFHLLKRIAFPVY